MKFTNTAIELPYKKAKPYQVIVICTKKHTTGVYKGNHIVNIVQDWVVRQWPKNFLYWKTIDEIELTIPK